MLRELDSRSDGFVTVSLLWEEEGNKLYLELESEDGFQSLPVAPEEASAAFAHPFVFASQERRAA